MTSFHFPSAGAAVRRCCLALAVIAIGAAPALAQDRLERLEREIGALQRYVYSGGPPGGGAGGSDPAYRERVEVRLGDTESELRDLTGRMEEVSHSVRRLQERLEKLVQDVDFRLTALERASREGGGSAEPAAGSTGPAAGSTAPSTPPRAGGSEAPTNLAVTSTPTGPRSSAAGADRPRTAGPGVTASLPTGSAMELYEHGRQLLSQTRYDEAETTFREFLRRHPDSSLTENARYWLGETYYVRKRYEDSAGAFLEGYQQNPKGSKAADNLLKLGLSLSALQKGQEACVALEKLAREYPNAETYVLRRAEQERSQLRCG